MLVWGGILVKKFMLLTLMGMLLIPFSGCTAKVQEPESKYKEEEVFLAYKEGKLFGSLMEPQEEGDGTLVIIIPGSGPTDRNGNNPQAGTSNNLKMVAEALSDHGIYSLRYDKRGIGESKSILKKESEMDFYMSIHDVISWIEKFKDDVRFKKILLLGHSEGALIAAAAEVASVDVDGLISVSGTALPADELLLKQLKFQSESLYEKGLPIVEELKKGNLVTELPVELFTLFRPSVQPYLISWFSYAPQKVISKVNVPVLILHGRNDLQVSFEDAKLLHQACEGSELSIIKGMNHILKDAPIDMEGNLATYNQPELPLSEGFMEKIIEFIDNL